MKKVIVFRSDLLHRSETFIKEQVIALTKWAPVLVGYREVENGLDLTGIDVRILPGLGTKKWKRLRLRLCQLLGIAHAPTVRALRAVGANLIHVHFGTDAVNVWPSVRRLGLPMLVTLHGYDINIYRRWWETGQGGLLMCTYPHRLLRMAKASDVSFIAVSKAIARRAIQYGIPEEKITVTYIGIDTKRFKPGGLPLKKRRMRILFVGRMVEKKAPLLMIHAYAEIRKAIPVAELIMIGDGPLLDDAKELADELGAPVQFLGSCNSDEVLSQLHEARVFCLPSVTAANGDAEGLPISIMEALACGIPVVTSARGAVGEVIINGENGFTFPEGKLSELTRSILEILTKDQIFSYKSAQAVQPSDDVLSIFATSKTLSNIYDITALVNGRFERDISGQK
jgi:glycosyltransferase involved in cell wall biosynthesis